MEFGKSSKWQVLLVLAVLVCFAAMIVIAFGEESPRPLETIRELVRNLAW